MKGLQIVLPFLLPAAITVALLTCQENPIVPNDDFVEPEMISINENLIFTYGPSWDTTFVPPDSLPMLVVELEPYEIGKYEVTNEEYEKFVRDGGYRDSAYWSEDGWNCKINENWSLPVYWSEDKLWLDDLYSNKKNTPIHGISYYEAEAYCKWLSTKTNANYHIPSSYQWVRAAKGPDTGTKYPWGNNYNRNYANFIFLPTDKVTLVEVYSFEEGKSIEGCYNMIGNVFEICLFHQYSNPLIQHTHYFSSASLAVSSSGDPCYRTMTTISSYSIDKDRRFYALGLRIVKEN
jgi:formylglycine-generating enzyme required for sulfatase activity